MLKNAWKKRFAARCRKACCRKACFRKACFRKACGRKACGRKACGRKACGRKARRRYGDVFACFNDLPDGRRSRRKRRNSLEWLHFVPRKTGTPVYGYDKTRIALNAAETTFLYLSLIYTHSNVRVLLRAIFLLPHRFSNLALGGILPLVIHLSSTSWSDC